MVDGPGTNGAGATGSPQASSSGAVTGSGNGGGVGRGDGAQPAGVGMAVASTAAGLTTGAAASYGIAYGLGALSAVCVPCAIGIGAALVVVAVHSLIDGGARSLYDSGNRIAHGNGTAGDFFSVSSAAGSLAGGALGGRAFAAGQSRAVASLTARATSIVGRAPLASALDGHSVGQGFTGVFDAATGRIALRPSAVGNVPAGWVPRRGGHSIVSRELGGNVADHAGFAAIIEPGGGLRLTWRSGQLNVGPDNLVPAPMRPAIVQAVEAATGRTVVEQ